MQDVSLGEVIFVTDPICSWCWGTLPEILAARDQLSDRLRFSFRCAGLQVGAQKPLDEAQSNQLIDLWQAVAETTGQEFAFALPSDASFIYHSELACRAIHYVRKRTEVEPWDTLQTLQRAFYVDCVNISDLDELFKLTGAGLDEETFINAMLSEDIVETARAEFEWCQQLETHALPTIFLDLGKGPKLVCGGYVTADYLVPDLKSRLTAH